MKINPKAPKNHKERTVGAEERKPPRKITERYLYNSGLHYLKRYTASVGHFKFIMTRKIKRSCAHHIDQDIEECLILLNKTAHKFIELGFLDDRSYAIGLTNSLRKKGISIKGIQAKLYKKRLPPNLIKQALEEIDGRLVNSAYSPELIAAITYMRRKRLGAFQRPKHNADTTPEGLQKNKKRMLSSLARAGYSYDISKTVLDMNCEMADDILRTERL